MFNLFKKKQYKEISDYPESWSILQNESSEFLIRINLGYKEAIGYSNFPIKLGIAIPVEEHNDEITKFKHSIEDFLVKSFAGDQGVLTAVITGLGETKFIEFLSYTNTSFDFQHLDKILQGKYQGFTIQMNAEKEPNWDTYKSFIQQ